MLSLWISRSISRYNQGKWRYTNRHKGIFTAALFIIVPKWENTSEKTHQHMRANKSSYSHIMKFCTAIKKEVVKHSKTDDLKCYIQRDKPDLPFPVRVQIIWFHLHDVQKWSYPIFFLTCDIRMVVVSAEQSSSYHLEIGRRETSGVMEVFFILIWVVNYVCTYVYVYVKIHPVHT